MISKTVTKQTSALNREKYNRTSDAEYLVISAMYKGLYEAIHGEQVIVLPAKVNGITRIAKECCKLLMGSITRKNVRQFYDGISNAGVYFEKYFDYDFFSTLAPSIKTLDCGIRFKYQDIAEQKFNCIKQSECEKALIGKLITGFINYLESLDFLDKTLENKEKRLEIITEFINILSKADIRSNNQEFTIDSQKRVNIHEKNERSRDICYW